MGVTFYFLLLSCLGLAITSQAQDCTNPVGGPNMSLRDEDILLNQFPEGSQVSFVCDVGYTSAGGSRTITCTAGSWSAVKLRCERKNCGAFEEVENGNIDYSEGTEFGAKIVITCNPGYRLVGRGEILCEDAGWNGRKPTCEVVACDPPSKVEHGSFSPDEATYKYRDVVQYSCQKGFTLNGTMSLSCSEDGTFQPAAPTCISVQCEEPVIKNSVWVSGSRPPYGHKATVTHKCNPGFRMKGQPTIVCELNSQWSPEPPTCELVTCAPPTKVDNGSFSPDKESYNYGDVVEYSCQTGFKVSEPNSISCSDDGTFKPATPTCTLVTCARPTKVEHGSFIPDKESYNYADVVQYSCQNGFKLSGSNKISCSGDETFKPDPPTCTRIPTTPKATTPTTTTTTTPRTKPKGEGEGEGDGDEGGKKDDGIKNGPVIGGVIGGILVLASCVCCYFWGIPALKKKKGADRTHPDSGPPKVEENLPLSPQP